MSLPDDDRRAFHQELWAAATERMTGFCWLLLALHAALLVRDVSLDFATMPANELSWARWLFGLHVAIALVTAVSLGLLRSLRGARARARVAFATMCFLLAWSALVSGADQLIGAGITLFLIINLSSALFVTFERLPTALAFLFGTCTFVAGQFWFVPHAAVAFSQLVNGTALALTCALFSRMLYGSKLRDFTQRITIARQHAELAEAHRILALERERSERVLYAVLPTRIADRLRHGESPIADTHPEVTIVFADLAGFTHLAAELPALEMVEILNELFSRFDEVAEQFDLEKIKTVGDAYLAARGLETPSDADVPAAAAAALALQDAVLAVARRRQRALSLRVGIARGVTMAGVLGHDRLLYDVWGDAVNTASRLETAAAPGEVLIPDALSPLLDASHELGPVKVRELKGKGQVATRVVVCARQKPLPLAKVL